MIVYLFICLAIWYICKAIRLDRRLIFKNTLIHLLSLLIINGGWLLLILVYSKTLDLVFKTGSWSDLFLESIPIMFGVGGSLYFIWVLIYYLIIANEEIRMAEQEVLKQRLFASQAELKALKTTIHPHFLFNGLNIIGPLIRKSPHRAQLFLNQLSEFLLYSLKYGKKQQVTVQDELDHISNYLGIEGERLGKRLQLDIDVDPDALPKPMLPLTLLPLVENAIKHGIGQSLEGGLLSISIKKKTDNLMVEIANPYEKPAADLKGEGLGLETLKKRIEVFYGPAGRVAVTRDNNSFKIKLYLPFGPERKNDT